MKILVNGGTGTIGSLVAASLVERGADVVVATRHPLVASVPRGASAVGIDGIDIDAMQKALAGVETLFLLVPVIPDELARAVVLLDLAREARLRHVVYFSMKQADTFVDVTHAASKFAAEQMIRRRQIPATVLRPNYFFQNDAKLKRSLQDEGIYPTPIGNVGVSMNDARDIADIAALKLLAGPAQDDVETIEIAGPDILGGTSLAGLWSSVLNRPVTYGGDDLVAFEKKTSALTSPWSAHDTAAMFRGFQREGMVAGAGVVERLTSMLGRPLRTYRAFAEETHREWKESWVEKVRSATFGK